MSPFQALRQFFTPKVDAWAPMDDPFVQIDRREAAKILRLEERGAEYGKQELPPASLRTFDPVEAEIISSINEHLNRAQIDGANQGRTYDQRLSELHLLHELAAIRSATEKALGDFKTEVMNWANRLANRRDAIADSYEELRTFKRANGLTRPVHSVNTLVVPLSTIAFAWLAEALGNSFFLKENDELGIIGGVIAAMVIAALNVAVSVYVGRTIIPRTNLREQSRRVPAYIGIALWALFLIIWNLGAAHFRDAKTAGIESPEAAALQMAWANPLGLDSLYSWALFVIGILAALLSARAGYLMDDPFPGYGAIGRRHGERCEDYAEEIATANEALKGIRDHAIEEAREVKRELGQQFRERARIMAAYETFRRRFAEHQEHLEDAANNLLTTYRFANRAHRTTPVPTHFDTSWEIAKTHLPDLHDEPLREADIKAAEEALDDSVGRISEAFDGSIHSFQSLDSLKRELAHAEV